jgi:hypothetical protein
MVAWPRLGLFQAVSALAYYWETNPGMIRQASHALARVLADSMSGLRRYE